MDGNPRQNYLRLKEEIKHQALACGRNPAEIQLVVVTKTCPIHAMQQVYEAGCRDFGENRIPEALDKQTRFPLDLRWHFIGTLQSNKVTKVVPHFHLIHSIDTPALAKKVSEVSEKRGVKTSIFLQVNTSGEQSKHGLNEQEWRANLKEVDQLPAIQLEGLMTMAPFTEEEEVIRQCFRRLRLLKDEFQQKVKQPSIFKHLSMGMSHDYLIAIKEGATFLRIGSAIFA